MEKGAGELGPVPQCGSTPALASMPAHRYAGLQALGCAMPTRAAQPRLLARRLAGLRRSGGGGGCAGSGKRGDAKHDAHQAHPARHVVPEL